MPRVSVVIPSYNHSAYLRQCIDSVLAQTHADWEIVAVDDCSSDDSVAILRSYDDPRIRVYVNERNMGTYPTENVGLDLATGDYIAILNSDDYWEPDKLRQQVEVLGAHPDALFSYTFAKRFGPGIGEVRDRQEILPTEVVHDVAPFLLTENAIFASTLVFRRGAVRFEPSLRYYGDWFALLELSRKGLAAGIREFLVHYREHGANTYLYRPGCAMEDIRVHRAVLEADATWFGFDRDPALIRSQLMYTAIRLHTIATLVGDKKTAKWALQRAGSYVPTNSQVKRRRLLRWLPEGMVLRRLGPGEPIKEIRAHYEHHVPEPLNMTPI